MRSYIEKKKNKTKQNKVQAMCLECRPLEVNLSMATIRDNLTITAHGKKSA